MSDFIKKQRLFKRIRNTVLILTVAFILVYIGVEPYLIKNFGNENLFQLVILVLVIVALSVLFLYESKYSKAEKFVEDVLFEVHDAGYYYTARKENSVDSFADCVKADLQNGGYKIDESVEANEMSFDFTAIKGNEFFYLVTLDNADRNDVIAYSDSALSDTTTVKMRSKGSAVVVLVCNRAEEDAIALSKSVQRIISGKRVLKLGIAIAELKTGRVYFRGNEPGVIQKLVTSYIMNCGFPVDEKYIGGEKLPFQLVRENQLKYFNLEDYKNGKYNER